MEQGADDAAGSFARGVVNRSATCGDVASRLQSDFFFGMPVVHREGPCFRSIRTKVTNLLTSTSEGIETERNSGWNR